jgi:hypothetical protein
MNEIKNAMKTKTMCFPSFLMLNDVYMTTMPAKWKEEQRMLLLAFFIFIAL